MIIGRLDTIEKELVVYPPAIQKGIQFLLTNDLPKLALGRHDIADEEIFAKVATYTTEPIEQRRPERHEKYIDLQCLVMGKECIGVGTEAHAGTVDTNALQARDILYYDSKNGMREEMFIPLNAGMFAVLFPWDVHRPNCNPQADMSSQVKKVVVKVSMHSLKGGYQ